MFIFSRYTHSFVLIVLILVLSCTVYASGNTDTFPKRKFYPQLNYIDTDTFANGLKNNQYDVIDVRDETSFKALHVKGAINIFIKSTTFEQEILDLVKTSKKPLVIYCNGISCSKSYVASNKILNLFQNKGIKKEVFTYDSGINALAYSNNDLVLKNGKEVSETNPLIDIEKIKQHTLKPADFVQYLSEHETSEYALLDIREKNEKIILKLFTFKNEKNIPLTKREKLIKFLNKIKQQDKTLLVFDSSGRQINGLHELLTITGIKQWYYMEGGEFGYSEYAIKSAGL